MADREFRVEAAPEAPKELDDIVCSDKNRRIGLLRIHCTYVLDRDRAVLRKACSWHELDSAMVVFDGARGPQIFEEKRDKARIGGGVEQGAFARPPPHRFPCTLILSLAVKTSPFYGQLQQIVRSFALSFGLGTRNSPIRIRRHEA